jgi:signal transduction histidine kinase
MVAGACFVAGFCAGVAGFAFVLVAASMLLHVVSPSVTAPVLVLGSLISQGMSLPSLWRHIEWPRMRLFLAVAVAGLPFGLLVLALGWLFFRESHRAMRDARERVSFVNHVSHELKTPLTNIQLYAELATERAEGVEDDTAVRYLGIIGTETARLSRLINNVLNLARKQRDRLTIQLGESILDDVVRNALETWRSPLESRGIELNLKLGAPEPMQIDSDAIEQILGNLISNVEKYALSGKYLGIFTETGAKGVRLTVEDRGAGVPVGMQETVFGAFERLRSDLTEGVSGTGIGLTISRELAHLHGGTLEVDAGYREGARFVLTLPKKPDENPGS